MKKRISRTRARISIILLALTLLTLVVGYFVQGWIPVVAAVVLALAAIFIRFGKCPTCGNSVGPMPQWSLPGKYRCPYCGARLIYDDEPEEGSSVD